MSKFVFLLVLSVGIFFSAFPVSTFAYPGCARGDMIIGWQMWAACNATTKGNSSTNISGWFLPGGKNPVFLSQNGTLGLSSYRTFWNPVDVKNGPCAKGYTLPNRWDWETAIYSARLNQTSLANLLALPQNGGWSILKTNNQTSLQSQQNVYGSYWSSTIEDIYGDKPIILHLGSVYGNTRMDGTDGVYGETGNTWQWTNTGLGLVSSESTEIANVRCIRS